MAKPQKSVADHDLIFDYPKVKKVKNFKYRFSWNLGSKFAKSNYLYFLLIFLKLVLTYKKLINNFSVLLYIFC